MQGRDIVHPLQRSGVLIGLGRAYDPQLAGNAARSVEPEALTIGGGDRSCGYGLARLNVTRT